MDILTESWTFVCFILANIATLVMAVIFFINERKPPQSVGEKHVD